MTDALVQRVAGWLVDAQSVVVSTGAGMSAESGVETFRDRDGLWSKFDPSELATVEAFERDPRKVWAWYRARRQQLTTVKPHAGHRVLARWAEMLIDYTLVTQNVDGLHERAGARQVCELHGRLDLVRCAGCRHEEVTLADLGPDPHCDACGARRRPGVVWFGEMLPAEALETAMAAADRCDVLLVIGTSGVVYPAAALVEHARARGAKIIEINPNETEHSPLADARFPSSSRDTLVALDEAWRARRAAG